MNIETLKAQLQELRMKTAVSNLEAVLAAQRKAVALDWLETLLAREIDARREQAIRSRVKRAEFPEITSLEAFDWEFNPDIDRAAIEELATLQFIDQHQIALFLGKPGTGKTHLALAIALRAVHRGHRVFCSSVKKLSAQIALARAKNSLDILFRKILAAKLWVLDDWGVVSMKSEIAEEVFDLLDRRRFSSALILTSNRDVQEWGAVFPDPVLAGAAIDRLFDRPKLITFTGKSYRLSGKITLTGSANFSNTIQGD